MAAALWCSYQTYGGWTRVELAALAPPSAHLGATFVFIGLRAVREQTARNSL